jgi:hypothetical protein
VGGESGAASAHAEAAREHGAQPFFSSDLVTGQAARRTFLYQYSLAGWLLQSESSLTRALFISELSTQLAGGVAGEACVACQRCLTLSSLYPATMKHFVAKAKHFFYSTNQT